MRDKEHRTIGDYINSIDWQNEVFISYWSQLDIARVLNKLNKKRDKSCEMEEWISLTLKNGHAFIFYSNKFIIKS